MTRPNRTADPPPLRAAMLTLLLAAVVICLALLGVLCLATARADQRLAEKQLRTLQNNAAAEALGAEWLAEAENAVLTGGSLPDGAVRSGNLLTAQLDAGDAGTLLITARAGADGLTVEQWQLQTTWEPAEERQLWNGE